MFYKLHVLLYWVLVTVCWLKNSLGNKTQSPHRPVHSNHITPPSIGRGCRCSSTAENRTVLNGLTSLTGCLSGKVNLFVCPPAQRQLMPTLDDDSGSDREDELPQVVVLKAGDLTAEEVRKVKDGKSGGGGAEKGKTEREPSVCQ